MATAPVPTAHLAARAPESPLAACPRAFPQSGRTALAFPSRPASRCSAPGSPLGRWRRPSPCRPPRSPPPRPAEGKGLPQEPPPSSQFERGRELGAEGRALTGGRSARPAGNSPLQRQRSAWGSAGAWTAAVAVAMEAVGVGLVDCHCHLSAPDFDSVCKSEARPVGAGGTPVLSLRVVFALLPWDAASDPPGSRPWP